MNGNDTASLKDQRSLPPERRQTGCSSRGCLWCVISSKTQQLSF